MLLTSNIHLFKLTIFIYLLNLFYFENFFGKVGGEQKNRELLRVQRMSNRYENVKIA